MSGLSRLQRDKSRFYRDKLFLFLVFAFCMSEYKLLVINIQIASTKNIYNKINERAYFILYAVSY